MAQKEKIHKDNLHPPSKSVSPPPHPPPLPIHNSNDNTSDQNDHIPNYENSKIKQIHIPQNRRMTIYVDTYHKVLYTAEANKRNVSFSELCKIALYEFLFKQQHIPHPTSMYDQHPIFKMISREDRRPKGIPIKTSKCTPPSKIKRVVNSKFGKVLQELKTFDISSLKKVPDNWRETQDEVNDRALEEKGLHAFDKIIKHQIKEN